MILTKEQFDIQWANNDVSIIDWFDTTYSLFEELEALRQPKSCEGCKNAVFPLPKICFNCERKSADLYEAKDNA